MVEVVGVVAGVDADIRQVAELRRELVGDAAVEPLAGAARGVDLRLYGPVDLAALRDPRALAGRDRPAERPVADVGDEVVQRRGASSRCSLGLRSSRLLVLVKALRDRSHHRG